MRSFSKVKRRARMEGVQAFILSMKANHRTNTYTESPTKNIGNLPSTIKRFTLLLFKYCNCKTFGMSQLMRFTVPLCIFMSYVNQSMLVAMKEDTFVMSGRKKDYLMFSTWRVSRSISICFSLYIKETI